MPGSWTTVGRVLQSSSSASVAGIVCTPNDRRRVARVFGSVALAPVAVQCQHGCRSVDRSRGSSLPRNPGFLSGPVMRFVSVALDPPHLRDDPRRDPGRTCTGSSAFEADLISETDFAPERSGEAAGVALRQAGVEAAVGGTVRAATR